MRCIEWICRTVNGTSNIRTTSVSATTDHDHVSPKVVPAFPPTNVGLIGALHEEKREGRTSLDEGRRASIESHPVTGFSTVVARRAVVENTLRSGCFLVCIQDTPPHSPQVWTALGTPAKYLQNGHFPASGTSRE